MTTKRKCRSNGVRVPDQEGATSTSLIAERLVATKKIYGMLTGVTHPGQVLL